MDPSGTITSDSVDGTGSGPSLAPAPPSPAPAFTPVASDQRIEALDVVRGFALLGIFLMNIEFFNRTFASFNEGMPRGLTGADWLASWFIAYFVQGKFWTIFSLLFGMGFAVMLVRAERAGREFTQVYLRRILALAVFGALHYIFLWEGDILFSYAVGALALLILLYGRPRPVLLACAVFMAAGFIPDAQPMFAVAGGLGMVWLLSLYLRSEKQVKLRGHPVPIFGFILMLVGALASLAALVFWLLPDGPTEPRLPLSVAGPLLLLTGWLGARYHQPAERRSIRLAIGIYVFFGTAMTVAGVLVQFAPDPAAVTATAGAHATPAATPASAVVTAKAASGAAAATPPKKTREQKAAEMRAERAKQLAEGEANKARELALLTTGSYRDVVDFRARAFPEKVAGDAGFAVGLAGMFLLGICFVRSGVMDNTAAHLPFFRKLAVYALPLGLGLGLLSMSIAVAHSPADRHDGWLIARGMVTLGNLAACLGYVGLVVVMLHSPGVFSRIRVLAPLGRMALTNYLTQSLICATYFFGYGFGHYGMPRSTQVLFVVGVYALQIVFSRWWLARFRYGPMEWLWRGFTYRQVPPLRIAAAGATAPAGAG